MNKKILLALSVFVLTYLLIGCVGDEVEERKKARFAPLSQEDRDIVGLIPKQYIHYGPLWSASGEKIIRATIVFDSNDINQYKGDFFSVSLFLTYNKNETRKNDIARYLVEERKFWESSYRILPPVKSTIGKDSSYIGEKNIETTVFEYIPEVTIPSNQEYLVVENGDSILFHRKHSPNKEKGLYGIYEYNAMINNKYAGEFHIKIHSFEDVSHIHFLYAKKFIESFYLKKYKEK